MALLRDGIYDAVRADILACRLAPGHEMREQEIAARYNVSTAPVRDALLRLERECLITVVPRQGSRVKPISIADARELFQLRLVLEPTCAAAACGAAPDILRDLDTFRTLDPGADFIAHDRAFHRAVANASGNRRMADLTSDVIDQSERLVRVSLARIKGRDPARLVAEHAQLVDAIQRRDARTASRLLRDHVAGAEKRVLSALAQSAVIP